MGYDLTSILTQLNVNAKDVAEFLGTYKSNFHQMIANKRPLPDDLFITLFGVENLLDEADAKNVVMPEAAEINANENLGIPEMLAEARKDLEYRILANQRKLDKLKQEYQRSKAALNYILYILEKGDDIRADRQLWLYDRLDLERINIENNGPHGHVKLQIKIAGLKAELAEVVGLIETGSF
jgi:hypothetical protein